MKKKPTIFERLFLYFGIIIAIPSFVFAAYAFITGQLQITRNIEEQASLYIDNDSQAFSKVLDDYRHKAYEISKNEKLISLFDENDDTEVDNKDIYTMLFDVMKGDTYKATVSVVSVDGQKRLSTHVFPERYDVRYYNTESDFTNPIVWNVPSTQTSISIDNRYVNVNGDEIVLSLLRNVFDKDGNNIGYVIVDVYDQSLDNSINNNNFFNDVLLINKKSYYAASLIDGTNYGNFLNFPYLKDRPDEFNNATEINGTHLFTVRNIQNTDLVVMGVIDMTHYTDNFYSTLKVFAITLAVGLLIALLLAYHFSRNMSISINNVINSMHKVEEGNMAIEIREHDIKELDELNENFNDMVIQLVKLVKQVQEDDRKYSQAEMKSLEAQLDPHFLFNTLNTIKAIARINEQQEIYEITIRLGTLLRSNLNNSKTTSTIDESISLVNDYLTIQKIRFGEKLHVSYDVDDDIANNVIPKLIIQPLVENSLKHGLEPKIGDWYIDIHCNKVDDKIVIRVRDNGVGLSSDFNSDFASYKNTTHVGLYNIYRRLDIHYEGKMKFNIVNAEDGFTEAKIVLPLTSRIANLQMSTKEKDET